MQPNQFLIYNILAIFILSSCSPAIKRVNYQGGEAGHFNCEVFLTKNTVYETVDVEKKGSIVISDTGFSSDCNERIVFTILKTDACALEANLIKISWESRPGLYSSCYQVSAEFFKIEKAVLGEMQTQKIDLQSEALKRRVAQTENRILVQIISYLAGFGLGFYLVTAF